MLIFIITDKFSFLFPGAKPKAKSQIENYVVCEFHKRWYILPFLCAMLNVHYHMLRMTITKNESDIQQ